MENEILISGCRSSGRTTTLLNLAKINADNGKRVYFWCRNGAVVKDMRQLVNNDNIKFLSIKEPFKGISCDIAIIDDEYASGEIIYEEILPTVFIKKGILYRSVNR